MSYPINNKTNLRQLLFQLRSEDPHQLNEQTNYACKLLIDCINFIQKEQVSGKSKKEIDISIGIKITELLGMNEIDIN